MKPSSKRLSPLPLRAAIAALALALAACQSTAPAPAATAQPAEVPAAARAAFDSALAAQRAQQWPEAERQFKQLAEKYPQLSGPLLNLALLYAQTQPDRAEPLFKQALQVNPNNAEAYDQYGIWLRTQGRFGDAENVYRQALTRWPERADSHLNLGILYDLYMGRLPEALAQYQQYLQLTGSTDSPVRGWVAELQRRLQATG